MLIQLKTLFPMFSLVITSQWLRFILTHDLPCDVISALFVIFRDAISCFYIFLWPQEAVRSLLPPRGHSSIRSISRLQTLPLFPSSALALMFTSHNLHNLLLFNHVLYKHLLSTVAALPSDLAHFATVPLHSFFQVWMEMCIQLLWSNRRTEFFNHCLQFHGKL